jgi:GTP-binding protein HflX
LFFFERPPAGTHALLVHVVQEDSSADEFTELVLSAGLVAAACVHVKRRSAHPKTYVGSGKLQELHKVAEQVEAELVIFDQDLTSTQERNIELALECRVIGRTGLILDIFGQRARTHEGQLQVELAQLQHMSTRLVRGWTHLDRQRGGSGRGEGSSTGIQGTGETQLESDQRQLRGRIKHINQQLDRVRKQRKQSRRARVRADVRTVSLVGYTNAGKSTLFNRLCDADVHAADQLFATLDPTVRQLELPVIGKAILTDTVGFIRHLPHGLVNAFRATLEEVQQASLLLHIVDAGSTEKEAQMYQVNEVLEEIDAQDVQQLLVYNKIDLIAESPRIDRDSEGRPVRVWISSLTGAGIEGLIQAISELLSHDVIETTLHLAPDQGQLRAELFALGAVVGEETQADGTISLQVKIEQHKLERLGKKLLGSSALSAAVVAG